MTNKDRPWDLLEAYAVDSQDVFVAAPYIKQETLGRLLGLVNLDAKLICVSRWRRREIASGVSDLECREFVVERGGEFRLHQSLHAKYYQLRRYFPAQAIILEVQMCHIGEAAQLRR